MKAENKFHFNGHDIALPFPVYQSLETEGMMIVLLYDSTMKRADNERSVYGLSPDGQIKWQIQKIDAVDPLQGAFWNLIGVNEEGNLFATNTGGYRCWVDPKSGCIVRSDIEKG